MEEAIDFGKCIICQETDNKKIIVKQPKFSSLKSLKEAVQERHNTRFQSFSSIPLIITFLKRNHGNKNQNAC